MLVRTEAALEEQLKSAAGFSRTLSLWRLSVGRAALSFVEGLLDSRVVEPIVYRPIGYVSSPHTELNGMPLQAMADTHGTSTIEVSSPHSGCLADLDGILPRVGHRPPRRGRRVGFDGANIPRQRTAWNVRDALAAASEPGRTLARSYRQRGVDIRVVVGRAGPASTERRFSISSPSFPLFDTASDDVQIGWFELHADGVFTRTSDDRFALRSRRA